MRRARPRVLALSIFVSVSYIGVPVLPPCPSAESGRPLPRPPRPSPRHEGGKAAEISRSEVVVGKLPFFISSILMTAFRAKLYQPGIGTLITGRPISSRLPPPLLTPVGGAGEGNTRLVEGARGAHGIIAILVATFSGLPRAIARDSQTNP